MRVLLVEDDRMIGEAIAQALRDASYAVDWVRDGQAAQDTVASQGYDVVLLDLGLPKKDGVAVLRSIRANDNPVPVQVITARDAPEDRIQGLDDGADDYLLKPFEMRELAGADARRHSPQGRRGRAGHVQWRTVARSGDTRSQRE